MKKYILLLLLSASMYAQQTETELLFKSELGYKITKSVTSNSSFVMFYYGYKNEKYKHIIDIGSIVFYKKSTAEVFANKLIEFAKKPSKSDVRFEATNYNLCLYDFADIIYIYDEDSKLKTLTKDEALKLGEEILTKIHLIN
jgi:hypothetical protein